ncbi:MAG: carboxymuconolactone decarboxylase family protein [Ramlibacter sp.]|nr:carboxymuconolactone decarboxylase family protein [Ramlibacter sp.]
MPAETTKTGAPQGFAQAARERLPMLADAAMTSEQRAVAQALIDGPRKAVYGPFVALLRSPQLLDPVAKVGEYLRFDSVIDARIRELVICAVARALTNQFEWLMHASSAVKEGVAQSTINALYAGARPVDVPADEALALDFTREVLTTHGASEPTYNAALEHFGEQGVVELTTLIGYFAMVSWLMNVAHTPAKADVTGMPLTAFPG